jgi:transcriptional regulator with XRE-family HTH domain
VPSPERPTRAALGKVVRALRQERGLTIEALAARSDMHPTYVSGIERGRNNPSWDRLGSLAVALEVRLSEIALRAEALSAETATRR